MGWESVYLTIDRQGSVWENLIENSDAEDTEADTSLDRKGFENRCQMRSLTPVI